MKQLKLTFLFTLLMSMVVSKAYAHDIEVNNAEGVTIYYNWINSGTELSVTYRGTDSSNSYDYKDEVVIPETVSYNGKTYSVTSIGEQAFYQCYWLTSVTIPNNVTNIGEYAFYDCSWLTSVTIPNSVTGIGEYAFYECSRLTSVIVEMEMPVNIAEHTFSNRAYATLYVPKGSKSAYETADYWKEFRIEETPICLVLYDDLYYEINDAKGTATVVGRDYIYEKYPNSYVSYFNYKADIIIPEKIIRPLEEWETWDPEYDEEEPYNHTFSIIAIEGGDSECFHLSQHRTYRVMSIGNAFRYSNITSITLPERITSIENKAFMGCYSLTSVTIPGSVTTIGDNAFFSCSSLTSVTIPGSVTTIGDNAFYHCNSITSVTVESDIPLTISENVIPNRANATLYVPLYSKSAYEKADYWKEFKEIVPIDMNIRFVDPEVKALCVNNWDTDNDGELSMAEAGAITSLGDVFKSYNYNVKSFDELRFFNGLTSIGRDVFEGVHNLESIIIPSNVVNLHYYSFTGLYNLKSIKVDPENAEYDSRNDCNAVIETSSNTLIFGCSKTTIPNDIKIIGHYAFQNCSELTSISIPNGVEYIGCGAFMRTRLSQVNLPNSVSYVDWMAFDNTPWEESQPDGLIYVGKVAYKYKGTMPENTSITIKDGTLGIAGGAFDEYKNLTSVTIPDGVVAIGRYAFNDTGLSTVNLPESVYMMGLSVFGGNPGTPWYVSQPEGLIYLGKVAYRYKGKVTEPDIVIKEGTRGIAGDAFMYQDGLVSVTIPSTVEHIDERAFVDCNNLINVTVYMQEPLIMDEWAFPNRSNATLYVPYGCKVAYEKAKIWKDFKEIVEMEPDEPTASGSCGQNVTWTYNSATKTLTISGTGQMYDYYSDNGNVAENPGMIPFGPDPGPGPDPSPLPDDARFVEFDFEEGDGEGVTNVIAKPVPRRGNSIYDHAPWYSYRNNIQKVVINTGVTTIGDYSFNNCSGLTSVTIGNSVTSIGNDAFCGCSNLTNITIPYSVTSIGSAFYGCSGLTSVTVEKETPFNISTFTFTNRANATLYVPYGSKAAYEAADYWKEFKEIVEMAPESIGITDISQLDNAIYIEPVEARCGTQVTLSVKMKNSVAVQTIQFDLYLPDGISVIANDDGELITASKERIRKYQYFNSSIQPDGALRLLAQATTTNIAAGDGEICMVTVGVPEDMEEGEYPILFKEMRIVEKDNTNHSPSPNLIQTKLVVSSYIPGDANGDGEIDAIDFNIIGNHILGFGQSQFNEKAADINGDGEIDAIDFNMVANYILYGSYGGANASRVFIVEDDKDPS